MNCCNYLDYRSHPHQQAFGGYSEPYQGPPVPSSYYPNQYQQLHSTGMAQSLTNGFSGLYNDFYPAYASSLDYSSASFCASPGRDLDSYPRFPTSGSYDGYSLHAQRPEQSTFFTEEYRQTKEGRSPRISHRDQPRRTSRRVSSPHQHLESAVPFERPGMASLPYYGHGGGVQRMTSQPHHQLQHYQLDSESLLPSHSHSPWSHYQGSSGWSMFNGSPAPERRLFGGGLGGVYPCRPHAVYHSGSPPHLAAHIIPTPPHPHSLLADFEQDPLRSMQAMQDECGLKQMKASSMQIVEQSQSTDFHVGFHRQSPSYMHPVPEYRASTPNLPSKSRSRSTAASFYKDASLPETKPGAAKGERAKCEKGKEAKAGAKTETKVEQTPLPAFQQAFGSTEIGRFSEAFTRSDGGRGGITEEMVSRAICSPTESPFGDDLAVWTFEGEAVLQLDASLSSMPAQI